MKESAHEVENGVALANQSGQALGSILAAAMVPAQLLLISSFTRTFGGSFQKDLSVLLPWVALVLLVVWKHRDNIRRLQEGTESKLWGAKQEADHDQA
jgi:glycerol-3-phosphate acyltransferase PlsY